jgi:hypothetical protein
MGAGRRPGIGTTVVIALVVAACSGPSGNESVSSRPLTSLEPSPTASAVSSRPDSTLSDSPSTASWYPWLPPIDTTVDAALALDTFVTARADVVPVSATPGGPPFRFDTGDPDPSTHPLIGFPKDGLLVVLHGPVVVDDIQWYLFTPAQLAVDVPRGWSPLWTPDGTAYVQPRALDCPASPVAIEQLAKIVLIDGLPVCYGDAEETMVGDLRCDAEADTIATGAAWLEGGVCRFEAPPSVYGLDPDLAPGRYAVSGHFLDEQARDCRSVNGDASPEGQLEAVLHCRRAFVATSAEAA